ncbi:MAG: tRNA pseudouridine(55) synthase TruB [Geodermatophilaceae bacterium]|nr:tRNA pseudouridine(55) synthase TruB [Geodermatophilaceae bacterium]
MVPCRGDSVLVTTTGPDGLAIVDKPQGLTSHDVVARMRRLADTRKVGHAGTLDPMATGVLVIGIGRATRLLGYVSGQDKAYAATIRLGASTVTDDAEGDVIATASTYGIGEDAIRAGLTILTGDIEQVPSSVSAIKVAGRRAYSRVRAGEDVILAARPVRVSALDLLAVRHPTPDLMDLDVTVECSTGTYIRALARDLGDGLGVGGHLTALRRTRVGGFSIEEARRLADLAQAPITHDLGGAVSRSFTRVTVDSETARALSYGQRVRALGLPGVYGVFDPEGAVVALVEDLDGQARPVVGFT